MRRAAIVSSLLSLATASLLVGCPDRSISELTPLQGRVEAKDIPITVNRDVDLLFLIDDSPSMADKQANLAANFSKFIDVLSTIQGGLPNIHIAVATSDMGTHGADGKTAPGIGTLGQGGCSGTGKNGAMQLFGAPVGGGPYISDIAQPDGSRARNYPKGTLVETFATMAKAGAGGCGFEQHLEAMKHALDPSTSGNPINAGFLRDKAFLAVIFIADEDDCSMKDTGMLNNNTAVLGELQSFRCTRFGVLCDNNGTTPDLMNTVGTKDKCHPNESSVYLANVQGYVDFLKGLKKDDPGKVIVAGIMGTSAPFATELRAPRPTDAKISALAHSCTYGGASGPEVADPPIRLKFFLDQFPNRSTFASICQADLSGGLQQIGDLLKTVIGDPCIEGKLADTDPSTPALDYDCAVSSVTNPTTAARIETILARCPDNGVGAATDPPCWHLLLDAPSCPNSDHYTLKIERQDTLPAETHVVANCVTEVTNN